MRKINFTLLELLIVIAIISMLAAILLPALNAAKEKAYSISCMNKLKSIGHALLMYADDNKTAFPPIGNDVTDSGSNVKLWMVRLGGNANAGVSSSYGLRWTSNSETARADSFVCPSESRILKWSGGMRSHYGLNSNLAGKNMSQIVSATQALMAGEALLANGSGLNYSYFTYLAFRHGARENPSRYTNDNQPDLISPAGKTNLLFADGHTENMTLAKVRAVRNASNSLHSNSRCSYLFTQGIK